jgi:DNA-binding beta-propeller fold protein YncE
VASDTGALITNISGLKQTLGVALEKEFGRAFISDGDQGKVVMFDLKTLKPTGEVKPDQDAHCVIYYPVSQYVFVMNGDPYGSTVIDAKSEPVVGTIDLGGAPEFAVADGKGPVHVNLEDKNELIAIDSRKLTIKPRWRVAPAGGPTALALDPEHRTLFSAGDNPQLLVVMDADMDTSSIVSISGAVDAAAYDPERP